MKKIRNRHDNWMENLYAFLANEEDARVCKAISDEACREVPGNYFLIFLSNTLSKIADRLASPKTTLSWLLQALAAPTFFLGIIVPLRESGSLIPQIFIARHVRGLPIRKWVWVLGSVLQGIAIAGIGLCAWYMEGTAAGWAIIALLVLFSLSRGICSVASKDVLGKTIPKTRRGRLNGLMSSASGLMALIAGAFLVAKSFWSVPDRSVQLFVILLLAASLLWILAAIVYAFLREFPGATEGGGNAISEALAQMAILKTDPAFLRFVSVRALAIGSGLSAPFIISLAHTRLGGASYWLGIFILVDGLSALLAAPILGTLADKDSRSLLRSMLLATFILLLLVIGVNQVMLPGPVDWVLFPGLFFVLGIIHSGVRLARKTYLVDMSEGNQRTTYVAVSNTVIGVLLLVTGAITGLLALLSMEAALFVFALCALLGWGMGKSLPDVSG